MSTPQEQFWAGDFGDSYGNRNKVDWRARKPFFGRILDLTGARSVGEVGANAGWNLSAIKAVETNVTVHGCEINEIAQGRAYECNLYIDLMEGQEWLSHFKGGLLELVFTSGVLIHIAPEHLKAMMSGIVEASSRYVLAIEYEAEQETEVEYRGHAERLWKRPYGKLYQEMGLTLIDSGDAGDGFDRCTFWLLQK